MSSAVVGHEQCSGRPWAVQRSAMSSAAVGHEQCSGRQVFAKIESLAAAQNFDEILAAADGITIARASFFYALTANNETRAHAQMHNDQSARALFFKKAWR